MSRISRWLLIAGTGGSVLGLAAVAPGVGSMRPAAAERAAQAGSLDTLPECPHDWELLPKRLGGRVSLVDGFALPGETTNVPEFHDCQKLILVDKQSGQLKYGPLVAVFAAYDLATLEQQLPRVDSSRVIEQIERDPRVIRQPVSSTTRTPTPLAGSQAAPTAATGSGVATLAGSGRGRAQKPADPNRFALAGALILNTSLEPYEPLAIQPGFSCLYLWRPSRGVWRAKLVFVGKDESRCLTPKDPADNEGIELSVRRDTVPGFERVREDHYPAVARWDWDSTRSMHYIGLKCGRGWCEVGRREFVSARAHMPEVIPPTHLARVQRIKGWYDEQLLSEPQGDSFSPSSLKGTFYPSPELQRKGWGHYTNLWVETGYVALSRRSDYYKKMLNLNAVSADVPLGQMNIFSMCYGARDACITNPVAAAGISCGKSAPPNKKSWWMRIKAAGSDTVLYRCVTRRDHAHVTTPIPGTARWRWLAEDETTWEACMQGCCQVEVRS